MLSIGRHKPGIEDNCKGGQDLPQWTVEPKMMLKVSVVQVFLHSDISGNVA